mgnify:CR=1 FL=1
MCIRDRGIFPEGGITRDGALQPFKGGIVKLLERAQADGDQIYAVIMGSAVNQDGRTQGMTVPNGEAQQIVILAITLGIAGEELLETGGMIATLRKRRRQLGYPSR